MSIASLIPSQLPSHITQNYPHFKDFLQGYYEWVQTSGSYKLLKDHYDYVTLKASIEAYTNYLSNEYLYKLPVDLVQDKEKLIRHSKDIIQNIGSEAVFKFFFKLIYDEDISVYYPKQDIFKISSGKWIQSEEVIYVTNTGNMDNFLFRTIEQRYEFLPGAFRVATAVVQNVKTRFYGNYSVAELYLTDVSGVFEPLIPITSNGFEAVVYPIGNEVVLSNDVVSGLTLNSSISFTAEDFTITGNITTNLFDTKLTTRFPDTEINVFVGGVLQLPSIDYEFDGQIVTLLGTVVAGIPIEVVFPIYTGYIVPKQVSNEVLDQVSIIDIPIGVQANTALTVDGSITTSELTTGTIRSLEGYYLNDDGQLSSYKKLLDSNFYQEFSYVIKTGLDLERYEEFVLDFLHPIGFKMFGQVDIISIIEVMVNIDLTIEQLSKLVYLDDISAELKPNASYIQNLIASWTGSSIYTNDIYQHIDDEVITYNINNNIPGTIYNRICYDNYVEADYWDNCYAH